MRKINGLQDPIAMRLASTETLFSLCYCSVVYRSDVAKSSTREDWWW